LNRNGKKMMKYKFNVTLRKNGHKVMFREAF